MPYMPTRKRGKKPERTKRNTDWVYHNTRWRRLRKSVLHSQPLCVMCLNDDVITEAVMVDHIEPVRVNISKAYDIYNLQGLCQACHNKKTLEDKKKYNL